MTTKSVESKEGYGSLLTIHPNEDLPQELIDAGVVQPHRVPKKEASVAELEEQLAAAKAKEVPEGTEEYKAGE